MKTTYHYLTGLDSIGGILVHYLKLTQIIALVLLFGSRSALSLELDNVYEENPPIENPTPIRINSSELVHLLATGEMYKLELLPSYEILVTKPSVFLRLYSMAGEKNAGCIPESHWECTQKYYLSVSGIDLPIETSLFYLGDHGEIADILWMKTKDYGAARIKFTVYRYPKQLLISNKQLVSKQEKQSFEALVRIDGVKIIQAKQ